MDEIVLSWPIVSAIIGLLAGWTAFLVGVIRVLIQRMIGSLDRRMDEQVRQWNQTDADLKRLMTDLPLYYQRRDDAIREYATINSKLDRLYELMVKEKQK